MNLSKILCAAAMSAASLLIVGVDADNAHAINPWGRPTYSGYPAYGYQYHYVHHHHYVYRPHYHHWHPAGWGNNGPYGGWYGGGFIWAGPGNCEACYQNTGYFGPHSEAVRGGVGEGVTPIPDDDVPVEPIPELNPGELPELP